MKALYIRLLLAVLVTGFFSCQPEIDPPIITGAPTEGSYLTKIITLDTTKPPGSDTVQKAYFSYDNAKRLKEISETNFSGLSVFSVHKQSFFYAGTDTLPYKHAYDYFSNTGFHHSDTMFLTYTNSVVSKDSTIHWSISGNSREGIEVDVFTIAGNTVNIKKREYHWATDHYYLFGEYTRSAVVSHTGQNLSGQILTGSFSGYDTVQVTYDNKLSPFRVIKMRYPLFEGKSLEDWLLQLNNPLHSQYVDGGYPLAHQYWTYTYGSNNYPTTVSWHLDASSHYYSKAFYFYSTL